MADTTTTAPTSDPIGEKIANLVDASVNRRLTPIRNAYIALRNEVAEIKSHPPVDPMALMMEALGSAEKSLENLDAQAVKEIEKEFDAKTETTT